MDDDRHRRGPRPAADRGLTGVSAQDAGAEQERAQAAKSLVRAEVRARRRARPVSLESADGERLADLVDALPEVAGAPVLAAYLARPGEPPTGPLLARWRAAGRRVLLPVVLPDLDLDWAPDDATRRPGRVRDVAEPDGERLGPGAIRTASVVVVPALAVDRLGHRLGQGGGSYDRALARLAPSALVVALLHPGELLETPLPAEPHDHRVDLAVTVEGVTRISPPA